MKKKWRDLCGYIDGQLKAQGIFLELVPGDKVKFLSRAKDTPKGILRVEGFDKQGALKLLDQENTVWWVDRQGINTKRLRKVKVKL